MQSRERNFSAAHDRRKREKERKNQMIIEAGVVYNLTDSFLQMLMQTAAEKGVPVPVTVEISPEMAKKMLKMNTKNRKARPYGMASYANDMLHNRWKWSSSIKLYADGVLADGQHRLQSIVTVNQPQKMILTVGVEECSALDRPMQRNECDNASMTLGFPVVPLYYKAIRSIYQIALNCHTKPSDTAVVEVYDSVHETANELSRLIPVNPNGKAGIKLSVPFGVAILSAVVTNRATVAGMTKAVSDFRKGSVPFFVPLRDNMLRKTGVFSAANSSYKQIEEKAIEFARYMVPYANGSTEKLNKKEAKNIIVKAYNDMCISAIGPAA